MGERSPTLSPRHGGDGLFHERARCGADSRESYRHALTTTMGGDGSEPQRPTRVVLTRGWPREMGASRPRGVRILGATDERPYAGPELRSQASDGRLVGEEIESVDDRVDQTVSRRRAGVFGDVEPDPLEVLFGQGGTAGRSSTASGSEWLALSP